MSYSRTRNESSLMYMIFCTFLIIDNLIAFTVSGVSGSSFIFHTMNFIRTIVSCAVPGFLFVKGYESGLSNKEKKPKTIFTEIKFLLYPYIITTIIYWIVLFILGEAELKPIALIKTAFSLHFYIVPVLIQFCILSPVINKIISGKNHYTVLLLSMAISIFSAVLLPAKLAKCLFTTYLLCYCAGFFLGKNHTRISEQAENKFIKFLTAYIAVLIAAEIVSAMYTFTSGNFIIILKQAVTCLYSAVASAFVLTLCIRKAKTELFKRTYFISLSKAMYKIFLWHMLPIVATTIALINSEIISEFGGFVIKMLTTAVLIFCIAYSTYRKGTKNGTE